MSKLMHNVHCGHTLGLEWTGIMQLLVGFLLLCYILDNEIGSVSYTSRPQQQFHTFRDHNWTYCNLYLPNNHSLQLHHRRCLSHSMGRSVCISALPLTLQHLTTIIQPPGRCLSSPPHWRVVHAVQWPLTLCTVHRSTRRSTVGDRAFPVAAAHAWNAFPVTVRGASTLSAFCRQLRTHLYRCSFD